MMSARRARLIRAWHERALEMQRASLPADISFMGVELHIPEDVFAPQPDKEGRDPFHVAVAADVRPGERALDMGTGSGVSGILAARAGADVVAVDINPKAIECARENAERNGVEERINFLVGDVFDGVDGDFDLMVFDPPFRWFQPRDMLEVGTADENYDALTRFIEGARERLRPGGRILLNFGTSGDMDYLGRLIERAGFKKEETYYGKATRDGMTARYYVIRLTD
jgi:release factor glutamine methyltransferase